MFGFAAFLKSPSGFVNIKNKKREMGTGERDFPMFFQNSYFQTNIRKTKYSNIAVTIFRHPKTSHVTITLKKIANNIIIIFFS